MKKPLAHSPPTTAQHTPNKENTLVQCVRVYVCVCGLPCFVFSFVPSTILYLEPKRFVIRNLWWSFQVHSLTVWNRVGARDFPTSHRKRSAGYRRGGGIPRRHTHLREYGGESSGHTRRSAKQTRQGRIEGEEVQM